MKLEHEVSSLEPSKRLKELGVKQESLFYWRLGYHISEKFDKGISLGKVGVFSDEYALHFCPKPRMTTADVKWNEKDLAKLEETEVSAFTVAELGEMLREKCPMAIEGETLVAGKWKIDSFEADTEANCRAKMLVYLLENKLITL